MLMSSSDNLLPVNFIGLLIPQRSYFVFFFLLGSANKFTANSKGKKANKFHGSTWAVSFSFSLYSCEADMDGEARTRHFYRASRPAQLLLRSRQRRRSTAARSRPRRPELGTSLPLLLQVRADPSFHSPPSFFFFLKQRNPPPSFCS